MIQQDLLQCLALPLTGNNLDILPADPGRMSHFMNTNHKTLNTMKRIVTIAVLLAIFAMTFSACQSKARPLENESNENIDNGTENDPQQYKDLVQIVYTESDEDFPNPERGFYFVDDFRSAENKPSSANYISANRKRNRTIVYHGYYLTDYIESEISEDYLQLIRLNMQALRVGGVKCILRFAYKDNESESNKPWDASPEWVARHIEQVKPILQEYGDVILCYQAGYVGVWGEWYYTDHFVQGPSTPEDYALRKAVVDAMLDALPADRQVALRTPMYKKAMYTDGNTYADSLTRETAHNGSPKARLACFNDCFGADASDMGTFGGGESRKYWKTESKYLLMGGETCGVSKFCKCEQTLQDMKDFHWTYLNSEYNGDVLGRWRKEGCMDEIERRLGYRFSLANVWQTSVPTAGTDLRLVLEIRNTGFSAPINPRGVELILIDGNGNKTVYAQDDVDPRYWFAGERHILDKTIKLPADASGKCTLYLNLPDPEITLHDNPLFSIRLANDGLWDEATGYNKVAEFTL